MGKITALKEGKGRNKRINVFVDGRFAFSLEGDVVVAGALRVGQELTASEAEKLAAKDQDQRGMNAAVRLLGYRPRSEAELRERLLRRGFEKATIDSVMGKLKEQNLVDDTDFARFWKENRQSFRPRSRRMTRLELRRKGVDSGVIDRIVAEIDDGDSAYRAAQPKARQMKAADYDVFRRRLGEYLRRRGFDYEVIKRTVEKMWQERDS